MIHSLEPHPSFLAARPQFADQARQEALEECLKTTYRLDPKEADPILQALSPLFTNEILLQQFLTLSLTARFTPPSEQTLNQLGKLDAVIAAPESHRILFENDILRILDASTEPGETVPFHTHQWDCIMVILQGSRFRVEDTAGKLSEEGYGPCVEKFNGTFTLEAYTNIGPQAFKAIAFEFKK